MLKRGFRLVEYGTADDVFHCPQAEYTRNLLAAIPRLKYVLPQNKIEPKGVDASKLIEL